MPLGSVVAPLVVVKLFAESGCPMCRNAVIRTIPHMLQADGVEDILDLAVYPFGNAYYGTEACGEGPYDAQQRHCWFARCVAPGAGAPSDCFDVSRMVAQHGETEMKINFIEACAISLNPAWKTYWPFFECMEEQYDLGATESCAERAGIEAGPIKECAEGEDGVKIQEHMAKATPDHPGVPYVLVNDKPLDNPDSLLEAVCAAYTGEKPAGCSEQGEGATILM